MTRRRWFYLGATVFAITAIAVGCYVFTTRDADFHVIGRKTHGVRRNLAMLEIQLDSADFRDCKTVQEALTQMHAKLNEGNNGRKQKLGAEEFEIWIHSRTIVDHETFKDQGIANIQEQPIRLPTRSETITVKQLLRRIFRQADATEVHFIVRWNYIEATNAKAADEQRARYLDSVSAYDRVRNWWKELNGEIESDPDMLITL